MKLSDFSLPFCISAAIHLAVLLPGNLYRGAEAVLDTGISVVTLNIVIPVAGRGSSPSSPPDVSLKTPGDAGSERRDVQPQARREARADENLKLSEPVMEESVRPRPASSKIRDKEERKTVREDTAREELAKIEHKGSVNASSPAVPIFRDRSRLEEVEQANRPGGYLRDLEGGDGDLEENSVTVPAMVVGLRKPDYPRYSRRRNEEGTVVLSVEIGANGECGKIEIVSSSGYSRLDRAAVQALESSTLIPAKIAGKPVSSTKRIAFTFRLQDLEGYEASRS